MLHALLYSSIIKITNGKSMTFNTYSKTTTSQEKVKKQYCTWLKRAAGVIFVD